MMKATTRDSRMVVSLFLVAAMLLVTGLFGSGVAAADEAASTSDVVMISATTLTPKQAEQTYTLTVVNIGANSILGLELASPVRSSQRISSFEVTQGSFSMGTWLVGRLAPAASATLTLIAV